jgi:3D (Asp-Asp-Asp) domain-containing protein
MRNIGLIISLPVMLAMLIPGLVIAEDSDETNTKMEFELDENVKIENGFVSKDEDKAPYNYNGYVSIDEEKREEKLKKLGEKQSQLKDNLPEGEFTGNFSAYTAAADECGKSDGITASGVKVKENRTLACPREYPFGTKIKIEGMGTYVCEDRGGAIKGNKFDIYMETKSEAFAFGRQNRKAEVAS